MQHSRSILAGLCSLLLLRPAESARSLRSSSSSSSAVSSGWVTGIATNYGGPSEGKDPYSPSFGTSDGSCGYGVLDKSKYPYWSVAALSTSNSFYKAGPVGGCGECFEIKCINSGGQFAGRCNSDPDQRSVTVMITDQCPECEADHIDIQALTYNKMGPMLGGRMDIQYRRVQCTPPTNIIVDVDSNSGTGGFVKMSVTTAGGSGAISAVQIKGSNSDWTGLHNLYGAEWELDNQPELPLDLHVVSDTGAELTSFGVITKSGQTGTLQTGVQFDFSGPASYHEASSVDESGSSSSASSASSSSSSSSSSDSSSDSSSSSSGSGASASAGGGDASASAGGSDASDSDGSDASSSSGGASASAGDGPSASAGGAEVSAYDGPAPSSPQSSSQGKAPKSSSSQGKSPKSSSSPASSDSCKDVSPGKYSCSQEKSWGHCNQSWMKKSSASAPKGFCAKTCGRC